MPENSTKERIVAAAVSLFACSGINGVSTKDIAHTAGVSEGNIFHYFPSKRDLFVFAVDSELGKLSVRTEVLARLGSAKDPRTALRSMFELITDTVVKQPELVRLLHFSALELGSEMEPLYRRHLDTIVTASANGFRKWSKEYGFRDLSAPVTVLSFVATVILLQNFYSVFAGAALPFSSVESAADAYAELWYRVLSTPVSGGSPTREIVPGAGVSGELGTKLS